MNDRPLILITNDDGVEAKGIKELTECLRDLGDIVVFAPDVYITKLRKLLKDDPGIEIINIHGKGYKLITPSGEEAAREEGIQVL